MTKILLLGWILLALLFKIPSKITLGLVLILLFLTLPLLLTSHHGFVENFSWYIYILLVFGFLQVLKEYFTSVEKFRNSTKNKQRMK